MSRNYYLILFGFSLILLTSCKPSTEQDIAMGTLEVDQISLIADSSEALTEILVKEGDAVVVGQVLARQDTRRIKTSLEGANAQLGLAAAKLAEVKAGPRAQEIVAAAAQVAAAESDLKTASLELERERSLVKQNYASKNQVDILQGRFDAALARKQQANAELAQLREGSRSEEIDAALSNFALAQTRVDDIQISLDRTTIVSTVDGIVETVLYDVGERPIASSTVLNIALNQTPYARVYVPEPLRTRLNSGARAEILIDGFSKKYQGRLRWIAHDANYTPYFSLTQHDRSHLSYLAEVDLIDPAAPQLTTGIPVQVSFPGLVVHDD